MSGRPDVIVIGAGVSGLTAAALLAKRGLEVAVVERNGQPGGSCGAFRRRGCTLDLGAAMLFGFGERCFNPHRFVMNELEEGLDVYRHEAMYRLWYGDEPVVFWPEAERFLAELGRLFPGSAGELRAFYRELEGLYRTVVSANSVFLSPTETPRSELALGLLKHPLHQARLLSLLGKSAMSLMRRRVRDERVYRFFNKLTSTYTYTTIEETPALLAVTMFVENHVGGSYSVAGSPMMLSARLEKAVEKFGGSLRYDATVSRILVEGEGDHARAAGVELESGERLEAGELVYSGTTWNLYGSLLPGGLAPAGLAARMLAQEPTFPSSVLYGALRSSAIPPGAFPVEMLIGNPERIDESDVTLYLSSLEDPGLAPEGQSVFMLIGPSGRPWPRPGDAAYRGDGYGRMKAEETDRMIGLAERRFPGFRAGLVFCELGTPSTVERYLLKNGGAVAGPKQRMGQELMKRQPAETFLPGLTMCGESTVMGTGTPAVTISAISAADVVLRRRGLPEYRNRKAPREYVRVIPKGSPGNRPSDPAFARAAHCQWCEDAPCQRVCPAGIDVKGIMRRLEADNVAGAARRLEASDDSLSAARGSGGPGAGGADYGPRKRSPSCASCDGKPCLAACARREFDEHPVPIDELLTALASKAGR